MNGVVIEKAVLPGQRIMAGEPVYKIADLDIQQGTSFHWHKERAANNVKPEIRAEVFTSVAQALKDADNFDLFIMDGAPAASSATRRRNCSPAAGPTPRPVVPPLMPKVSVAPLELLVGSRGGLECCGTTRITRIVIERR